MSVIGKLIRALVYTVATGVIVLALLVGIVRLLLPLAPQYQQQIRQIAANAIGYEVDFRRISASWPLRGPELKLYGVRVIDEAHDRQQLLAADEVAVGLSLTSLLLKQSVAVSHIGVTGARVEVVRERDRRLRVQGRWLDELLPDAEPGELPDLELLLEDIFVRYQDRSRGLPVLDLGIARLAVRLQPDGLGAEGRLELGGAVNGQLDVGLVVDDAVIGPGSVPAETDWRLSVTAEDFDAPPLLAYALPIDVPVRSGRGSVTFAGRFHGASPVSVLVEVDLHELEVSNGAVAVQNFDGLAGKFEWERHTGGWLLAATGLRIARDGRTWPDSAVTMTYAEGADERAHTIEARADYLRLQDIHALLSGFLTARARDELLPDALEGEIHDASFRLELTPDSEPRYQLSAVFDGLGVVGLPGGLTVTNLGGNVVADQAGGRLQLDATESELALPALLLRPVQLERLEGFLVWRNSGDQLRVLSDSFRLHAAGIDATTRFELSLPRSDQGVVLDLDATVSASNARNVLPFLPLRKFPPKLSEWLQRAIREGAIPDARVRFSGPLREFPYDHGEGLFHVDMQVVDGVLDYAKGWPPVTDLAGQFVFDGVQLYSRKNSGRIAGLPLRDRDIRFDDLRKGVLKVSGEQTADLAQLLGLLRALPVSNGLQPTLGKLSGKGTVASSLSLRLPVLHLRDYRLDARFDARDCELQLQGVDFGLSAIRGRLKLRNTRLSADRLVATLLDEPVTIKLRPATTVDSPVSHFVLAESSTPIQRWIDALHLPDPGWFSGTAKWRAMALIPAVGRGDSSGVHILVRSDLKGVTSEMPRPFGKTAAEPAPLRMDIGFTHEGVIDVSGRLRRDLGWVLRVVSGAGGWQVDRGSLQFGSGVAQLPDAPGITLAGELPHLRLTDWLALARGEQDGTVGSALAPFRSADWTVGELDLFGEVFHHTRVQARRAPGVWQVDLTGADLKGSVTVPEDFNRLEPWQLQMQRLWLAEQSGDDDGGLSDPRGLPPVSVTVDDFGISDMHFGHLLASIQPGTAGVTVSPLEIDGGSFHISGDAAWLVVDEDPARQTSRLRVELVSTDLQDTLKRLSYDPVIDSHQAKASVDLSWPGPPAADFLAHASGRLHMEVRNGSLVELEPGGGRLLGILSVTSLPRRLSLDFRDVFDQGFSFDILQGDFSVNDGQAFTCNLGIEGPVADMGIVGRTGLRDRDYDQLAVVRPHVSNVLVIGGAVVAGPAVGAAALLISQIFRKQLSQLGESYYQIVGSWENPTIERVQRNEVDSSRFKDCERYLSELIPEEVAPEEQVVEPGTALPPEIVP